MVLKGSKQRIQILGPTFLWVSPNTEFWLSGRNPLENLTFTTFQELKLESILSIYLRIYPILSNVSQFYPLERIFWFLYREYANP